MPSYIRNSPLVQNDQRGRDGVDEVDASEQSGAVAGRCKGQEPAAQDARYAAGDEPGPAVGAEADAVADSEDADDGDETAGHIEESGDLGCVAECLDDGRGVGRNDAARNGDLLLC